MQNRSTRHVATFLCLSALAVLASPAGAIENGKPDSGYQNVGLFGFDIDGPLGPTPPFGICSGFVISDRAFVTAAHCLTPVQDIAQSWAVTLQPGSPSDPISPPGVFDLIMFNVTDFPILVETAATTMAHIHPDFDPDTLANDVAVIEFPAGTFQVEPVRLASYRFLDSLNRKRLLGRVTVGVVGYGGDQDLGNFQISIPGFRKRGVSGIGSLSRTRLTLEPTAVRDADLLAGDSGSPQFVLDRAVALRSTFDYQRLDTPRIRRWLLSFTQY